MKICTIYRISKARDDIHFSRRDKLTTTAGDIVFEANRLNGLVAGEGFALVESRSVNTQFAHVLVVAAGFAEQAELSETSIAGGKGHDRDDHCDQGREEQSELHGDG